MFNLNGNVSTEQQQQQMFQWAQDFFLMAMSMTPENCITPPPHLNEFQQVDPLALLATGLSDHHPRIDNLLLGLDGCDPLASDALQQYQDSDAFIAPTELYPSPSSTRSTTPPSSPTSSQHSCTALLAMPTNSNNMLEDTIMPLGITSVDSPSHDSADTPSTTVKPRPFHCTHTGCTSKFAQKAGLTAHLVTHTGERRFACMEPDCGKAYTTNNRLKVHTRSAHSNLRPFKCQFQGCTYSATQACTLNNHALTHLSDLEKQALKSQHQRTLPCPACNRLYKTRKSLVQHARLHHRLEL
ncbi:Strongly-conserved Zn-finger binding protein (TFIIIA) [Chytriomyces hyalinus]|nr:Strongly-conserved Zn-finger binding protein (TFIIIA) [Chytriomyces hyalinus]